ncbi:MAG: hypothetical protein RR177_06805 [Oscillospiraceae bacterium]
MPIPKDKKKFSLWVHEETLNSVDELYKYDNCSSRSEFIENAILFYAGYLTANNHKSYLANMFISTMKAIVNESDNRTSCVLFKLAVELAITMNIIAADHEIDDITLERLRGECVQEVKYLNGSFRFDDAVDWQKG